MFPVGHPYSWPIIGSMEDLNAASLEDVKHWFETYYGAANAVLVIAGDVDPEEIYSKVQHYFGDIDSGPALTKSDVWIAKRDETKRDVMYDNVAQARIAWAWNTPQFGTPENAYLELAAEILGSGKNSRLYKRLVYDDQIATSVGVYQGGFEIAGMFEIDVTAKPGVDLQQIETAVQEELHLFLTEGPTDDELERVKNSGFASAIRGLERLSGKAQLLASYETYMGDAGFYKEDLFYSEAATAEQVQDTARKWLSSGDFILEILPQENFSASSEGADRSQMPGTGEAPELTFPNIQEFSLSNGIRVLLVERTDLPLVEMRVQFAAGYASDPESALGLSALTSSMIDEGTVSMDALELSAAQDQLGARISSSASLDTSVLSLSALKVNLEESVELFAEVMRRPSFPQEELDRVLVSWMARIDQEETDPTSVAYRNLPPLLYGDNHPYGIPFTGSGTRASIGSIEREDLVEFHRSWLHPDNATLMVVGNVGQQELAAMLEEHLGDWNSDSDTETFAEIPSAPISDETVIYLIDKPDSPQSVILGGQLLPSSNAEDIEATDMALRILGGTFNARLNINLREDKGWSYGVRAFAVDAAGQRPMIYSAPVQSDKTVESLQELIREGQEYLRENPATTEELDLSREGIVRGLPGTYETNRAVMSTLSEIVRFGLPLDHVTQSQNRLRNMTLEQVNTAAATHFRPDQTTWLVIGDLNLIEQPLKEAGIAEVVVLDLDAQQGN